MHNLFKTLKRTFFCIFHKFIELLHGKIETNYTTRSDGDSTRIRHLKIFVLFDSGDSGVHCRRYKVKVLDF